MGLFGTTVSHAHMCALGDKKHNFLQVFSKYFLSVWPNFMENHFFLTKRIWSALWRSLEAESTLVTLESLRILDWGNNYLWEVFISLPLCLYGPIEEGQQPVLTRNNGTGIWGVKGRDIHDWRGGWFGSIPTCFSAGKAALHLHIPSAFLEILSH